MATPAFCQWIGLCCAFFRIERASSNPHNKVVGVRKETFVKSIAEVSMCLLLTLGVFSACYAQSPKFADKYWKDAQQMRRQGKYLKAAQLYEKSAGAEKASPKPRLKNLASELTFAAYYYAEARKYDRAINLYEEALTVEQKLGREDEIAKRQADLIHCRLSLGKEAKNADKYLDQAIKEKDKGKYLKAAELLEKSVLEEKSASQVRHRALALELGWAGYCHYRGGQYDRAVVFFKEALAVERELERQERVAALLKDIGNCYKNLDQVAEALPYYEESLARSRILADQSRTMDLLHIIGKIRQSLGENKTAIQHYEEALAMAKAQKRSSDVSSIRSDLDSARAANGEQAGLDKTGTANGEQVGLDNARDAILRRFNEIEDLRQKKYDLGISDPRELSEALAKKAKELAEQGRYREAVDFYEKAAEAEYKSTPLRPKFSADLAFQAGLADQKAGRHYFALMSFRGAEKLLEKAYGADSEELLPCLTGMAAVSSALGIHGSAEDVHRRALGIEEKRLGPDDPVVARRLHSLAATLSDQSKYAEAEQCQDRALEIWEKALGPNDAQVSHSLMALGSLYDAQGKWEESKAAFVRALEIREQVLGVDHLLVATCLDTLAAWMITQEQSSLAQPLLRRALTIMEGAHGPNHIDLCTILGRLALTYTIQGDYDSAGQFIRRSLVIAREEHPNDHPMLAPLFRSWAKNRVLKNQLAVAEMTAKQALRIDEEFFGPDHPRVASSLFLLSHIHVLSSRPDTALSLYKRGLFINLETMEKVFPSSSEQEKFWFLRNLSGNLDIFYSLVSRKLLRSSEAARALFEVALRSKGLVLDALSRERLALLSSEGEDQPSAEVAIQLQVNASRLASMTLASPGGLSADMTSRLGRLKAERDSLEEVLSRLSNAYAADRKSRHADAEQVARALEPGSALVEYVGYNYFDFDTISRKLLPLGLGTFGGDHRYLAIVLPAGEKASPILIDLGSGQAVDEVVRDFRREIENSVSSISDVGEAAAERQLMEKGKRVYELIFAPLRQAIGDHTVLYLAPDGELNLVPFGVLPDGQGDYLAETYQFNYLSSGRDLLRFGSEKAEGKGVAVMADPDYNLNLASKEDIAGRAGDRQTSALRSGGQRSLDLAQVEWDHLPGTRKEAEMVARTLSGQQVQLYLGDRALESAVKDQRGPRILHLATHGFFLDQQVWPEWSAGEEARGLKVVSSSSDQVSAPDSQHKAPSQAGTIENPLLRSGLVFAGANRLGQEQLGDAVDDGILTALEVSGIPLWGTDLVVLSACETGLGETKRGEGVFGLRRAFQLAGARTVVMSLWSVPDEETSMLMSGFYDRLRKDLGKSKALQEASLALMRERQEKGGSSHPYYWGAFICVGEP